MWIQFQYLCKLFDVDYFALLNMFSRTAAYHTQSFLSTKIQIRIQNQKAEFMFRNIKTPSKIKKISYETLKFMHSKFLCANVCKLFFNLNQECFLFLVIILMFLVPYLKTEPL